MFYGEDGNPIVSNAELAARCTLFYTIGRSCVQHTTDAVRA